MLLFFFLRINSLQIKCQGNWELIEEEEKPESILEDDTEICPQKKKLIRYFIHKVDDRLDKIHKKLNNTRDFGAVSGSDEFDDHNETVKEAGEGIFRTARVLLDEIKEFKNQNKDIKESQSKESLSNYRKKRSDWFKPPDYSIKRRERKLLNLVDKKYNLIINCSLEGNHIQQINTFHLLCENDSREFVNTVNLGDGNKDKFIFKFEGKMGQIDFVKDYNKVTLMSYKINPKNCGITYTASSFITSIVTALFLFIFSID